MLLFNNIYTDYEIDEHLKKTWVSCHPDCKEGSHEYFFIMEMLRSSA